MVRGGSFLTQELNVLILGGAAVFLAYRSGFFSKVGQGIGDIGSGIGAIGQGTGSGIASLGAGIGGGVYNLGSGIGDIGSGIGRGVSSVGSGVEQVGFGINNALSGLGELQTEIGAGFQNFLTQLGGIGGSYNTKTGALNFGSGANTPSSAFNNYTPVNTTIAGKPLNVASVNLSNAPALSSTTSSVAMPVYEVITKNPFGTYSPVVNGKALPMSVVPTGKQKIVVLK